MPFAVAFGGQRGRYTSASGRGIAKFGAREVDDRIVGKGVFVGPSKAEAYLGMDGQTRSGS